MEGVRPTGDRATTIFDLREDRVHVAVYPATVDTFAILIDRDAVQMLLATAESGDACAVPGLHAVHGRRLLGLRPFDASDTGPAWIKRPADAPTHHGSMELYVHLPGDQIHIIHGRDLQGVLTEILDVVL